MRGFVEKKISWISQARFQPYLDQTNSNIGLAWELYEWNASISAALSETIHHVEVLVRNSMLRELERVHPLAYPWTRPNSENIAAVATRLTDKKRRSAPDHNDVMSQLNLGFWTELVYPSDFQKAELWRNTLSQAFPAQDDQELVGRALEDLRELRNRCSHQDSLLQIDPLIEMKKIERLCSWIDPEAAEWIRSISRVSEVLERRPQVSNEPDTVIIASTRNRNVVKSGSDRFRYPLYDCFRSKGGIVLEDTVRLGREVTHIGFYLPKHDAQSGDVSTYVSAQAKAHIAREFPTIQERVVPDQWSRDEAARLSKMGDERSRRIASIMKHAIGNGYAANKNYVIYLLSGADDASTVQTPVEIVHNEAGQGSAFVKLTRYHRLSALSTARLTSDL